MIQFKIKTAVLLIFICKYNVGWAIEEKLECTIEPTETISRELKKGIGSIEKSSKKNPLPPWSLISDNKNVQFSTENLIGAVGFTNHPEADNEGKKSGTLGIKLPFKYIAYRCSPFAGCSRGEHHEYLEINIDVNVSSFYVRDNGQVLTVYYKKKDDPKVYTKDIPKKSIEDGVYATARGDQKAFIEGANPYIRQGSAEYQKYVNQITIVK